jgi:hypothetical protein
LRNWREAALYYLALSRSGAGRAGATSAPFLLPLLLVRPMIASEVHLDIGHRETSLTIF